MILRSLPRLLLVLAAAHATAAVTPAPLPCTADFEGYAPAYSLTNLAATGWGASDGTVVVQTNVFWTHYVPGNTRAVELPGGTELSNALSTVSGLTNLWTDFEVVMVIDEDLDPPTVNSNGVLSAYVNSNGWLTVFDRTLGGGAWRPLSNTVLGADAAALTNGQWARVAVHQDYAAHRCAVFLDGVALCDRLPFVSNLAQCASFRLTGAQGDSCFFDNYRAATNYPAGLSVDLNLDGLPDVREVHAFGYVSRTLTVGPGQAFAAIQDAAAAALARDTLAIVGPGPYAGNLTLDHAVGPLTGQVFTIAGNVGIGTGVAITTRMGFASTDLVLSNAATLNVDGNLAARDITLEANARLTVSGTLTNRDLTLGPDAQAAIGGHLSLSNLTLDAGARLSAAGVTADGALTVDTNAALDVNGDLTAGDLTVNGGLSLAGDLTGAVLTLGTNVTVALTNVTVSVTTLQVRAGARLIISNGTVSANGLLLSGSFTLDDRWGDTQARSTLPFLDDFENYEAGVPLNWLGFRGWGASSDDVTVQSNVTYAGSGRAVGLTYGQTVSNRVEAAGLPNVWTDLQLSWAWNPEDDSPSMDTSAIASVCVNAEGFVTVYNGTGWDVCSNDVNGATIPALTNGQWFRLSVLSSFARQDTAVFVDGRLLRQKVPFIATPDRYSGFRLSNEETNGAAADAVSVGTTVPDTLTGSYDGDSDPDALEIHRHGDVWAYPRGTTFRFR